MRPLIKWIFNNRPLGLPPAGPGPAPPPPLGLHPAGLLGHRHLDLHPAAAAGLPPPLDLPLQPNAGDDAEEAA